MSNTPSQSAAPFRQNQFSIGCLMWGTLVVAFELALIRYLFAGGSLVRFALALVMPFAFLIILMQKQAQWLSPNPNIESFELSSPATPQAVREYIEKDEALIESLGFQRLGYLCVSDFVPGITSFIALYESKPDQQIAAMINAVASAGQARRPATALAFQTWFANQNMLETNNTPIASIVPETNSAPEVDFVPGDPLSSQTPRNSPGDAGPLRARPVARASADRKPG